MCLKYSLGYANVLPMRFRCTVVLLSTVARTFLPRPALTLPGDTSSASPTDCPYMGPDKGVRNDPTSVIRGVAAIAKARNMTEEEVKSSIRENFARLFGR